MANSYIQAYIHYVFTVKYRENLINPKYNDELQKYITWIVSNNNCKMIAINNMPDHFHIFVWLNQMMPIAKLIQEIKASSSKFINEKGWFNKKFAWQVWYWAFSYSHSQIDNVCKYIINQQEHHKKSTFKNEYLDLLKKNNIQFDEQYLFEFYQ